MFLKSSKLYIIIKHCRVCVLTDLTLQYLSRSTSEWLQLKKKIERRYYFCGIFPEKRLRWSRGSVLAFGTQFAGSNPAEAVGFLKANKNPHHVGGRGCFSVVIVVCCQVEVSATN